MATCQCTGCMKKVNKFSHLTPAQVFNALEHYDAAVKANTDCYDKILVALNEMRAATNPVDGDAALDRWSKAHDEYAQCDVPAYVMPVKRWAGGPPELDAWYWDYNSF